jgi:hypothetical protein
MTEKTQTSEEKVFGIVARINKSRCFSLLSESALRVPPPIPPSCSLLLPQLPAALSLLRYGLQLCRPSHVGN